MDLLFGDSSTANSTTPAHDLVKDSNTQNFMRDVIDVSMSVPVIVDFWAPWCGPCKQLMPILERLVRAANGRVRLVKINADENQQLAQQMQVRSVPTIFAIKDGRPMDMLVGAQTESQLRAFIDRISGNANMNAQVEAMLETARMALANGEVSQAVAMYQQILQAAPGNPGAIAGFLRCNLALGRIEQAQAILAQLPEDLKKNPEIASIIGTLALAAEGAGLNAAEAAARLAANPDDHQARHDLAMAAYVDGNPETTVHELLEIVRRDRTWNDDGGRKQLLRVLEALGPTDPVAKAGRRKLQMMLMV